MNVHKYITQNLKSNTVQKSLISRSIRLTHPMVYENNNENSYNNVNNTSFENMNNRYPNTNEGIEDDIEDDDYYIADEDDISDEQDELNRLRIRFISISSVSSSAFAPSTSSESIENGNNNNCNDSNNLLGLQTKSLDSNLSNHLRVRSNTLERLEEEKRVRWYDEHFGTLISNSNLSSLSSSSTLTSSQLPNNFTKTSTSILPTELPSYPIKPSTSFELLTSNSPTLIRQKGYSYYYFYFFTF